VSVVLIDLDHFKGLNDEHGHLAGDDVLQQVGLMLRHGLRSTDRAFRYGGEELLLLLPETNAGQAREVAERIRAQIAKNVFEVRGAEGETKAVSVTGSFGLASAGQAEGNRDVLLQLADAALYEAKHTGRNRVVAAAD
jgi:two-component system cell cycle response regulator